MGLIKNYIKTNNLDIEAYNIDSELITLKHVLKKEKDIWYSDCGLYDIRRLSCLQHQTGVIYSDTETNWRFVVSSSVLIDLKQYVFDLKLSGKMLGKNFLYAKVPITMPIKEFIQAHKDLQIAINNFDYYRNHGIN